MFVVFFCTQLLVVCPRQKGPTKVHWYGDTFWYQVGCVIRTARWAVSAGGDRDDLPEAQAQRPVSNLSQQSKMISIFRAFLYYSLLF